MSEQAIGQVRALEAKLRTMPQEPIATDHVLHAGMYARTICIPAGVVLTGVLIRIPTLLIACGDFTVFVGDEAVELHGYHALAASAHRRQAFVAHTDTYLTMVFATQAKSVEDAENEFTAEADLLFSRKTDAVNHIHISGE